MAQNTGALTGTPAHSATLSRDREGVEPERELARVFQRPNLHMSITASQSADINVTPMIDVLLVLIIVFMVITPLTPMGLSALLPRTASGGPKEPARDIVITVARDNSIRLNREPVELAHLQDRLSALLKRGASEHLFVRGDRDLDFREVVQVIDLARGAGWDRVGLMTQ